MFILNQQNSIANHFLAELRDIHRQKDRLRFRKNLERLGEIMAYEISRELEYQPSSIESPFQKVEVSLITQQPVIITVMRASIPFYQGVLNFFDGADSGFVGAFRKELENKEAPVEIDLKYIAAPSINNRYVIIVDPMLATGKSFVQSINNLLSNNGTPTEIHIASVIATPEGIDHIRQNLKVPHRFWTCALDEELNAHSYIIPGLGDAGDLAFGPKL
ncbi:uracil phosphoribosyltransferase [Negadavirga shengliensis]|uniref:Uracil phosphoribosyltransferase n=1 Tax=Negadavirga shengliensis TaxID=1389218 RepID=A0ABV9SXW8_9BACT